MTAMVELMEPRRMLATTPVVAVAMTGSEQKITGIVLTFNIDLDPATAQDPRAYFIGRNRTSGGDAFWDPLGLNDPKTSTSRIKLQSAVYEPASRTVTLTPATPFDVFDRFRRIRVSGRGPTAVKDATGVPLDGNGDARPGGNAVLRTRIRRTTNLTFRDNDGDRARLRLLGPGKIWAVVSRQRGFAPLLFLNKTSALKTGLTGGVVRNRRTGDGVVTIRQLSGTAFASVPILLDPAFRVELVTP